LKNSRISASTRLREKGGLRVLPSDFRRPRGLFRARSGSDTFAVPQKTALAAFVRRTGKWPYLLTIAALAGLL